MDYEKAEKQLLRLHRDPAVQEPTRSWAGVEATLVAFLDGRPADARKQARETRDHLKSLPENQRDLAPVLGATLEKISGFPPVPAPEGVTTGASSMLATMLAGLKNWEQGLLVPAAACFTKVAAAELPPEDMWAAIYQKLAGDYLADFAALSGPVFNNTPPDRAGCVAAVDELNTVLATLKTRGRARYNVRAWQLDLTRRGKLLAAAPPENPDTPGTPHPALDEVLAKLSTFSNECRFSDAVVYLKSLPADLGGATRASLLAMAGSASVFLADIESDLSKGPVTVDLPMKSGETMAKIAISPDGTISVATADGKTLSSGWGEFSPDALVQLHRVLVKNTSSELELLRRHECAIAFDWLAGNRQRALDAAAVLGTGSKVFKERWENISAGLPK